MYYYSFDEMKKIGSMSIVCISKPTMSIRDRHLMVLFEPCMAAAASFIVSTSLDRAVAAVVAVLPARSRSARQKRETVGLSTFLRRNL